MYKNRVRVPAELLLHPLIRPSAKLTWMVYRLFEGNGVAGPTLLSVSTGLCRSTIYSAWTHLGEMGWDRSNTDVFSRLKRNGEAALMPGDLLTDRRVSPLGKILYGVLQLPPFFGVRSGRFSYAALSERVQIRLGTIRPAIQDLMQAGWLIASRASHLALVDYSLADPVAARGETSVEAVRRRIRRAQFLGETLMREYLTLVIDSSDYEDNARPGFLVNPFTEERMELDRFYPPSVAYEFNGLQHYGATELFTEQEAVKQQARDYMKVGICSLKGINLQILHAEDLFLEGVRRRVPDVLPLRDLRGCEPIIRYLESVGREYREYALRGYRRWVRGSLGLPSTKEVDRVGGLVPGRTDKGV